MGVPSGVPGYVPQFVDLFYVLSFWGGKDLTRHAHGADPRHLSRSGLRSQRRRLGDVAASAVVVQLVSSSNVISQAPRVRGNGDGDKGSAGK
jgi:hypothetical protein